MRISHLFRLIGLPLLCLGCAHLRDSAPAPAYDVQVRRTEFGIPHIQAGDYGSLGYGMGYAYAQDNVCIVADQVLTVRGERARFLGGDGRTEVALRQVGNVDSDFYFNATMDDAALRAAYVAVSAPAAELLRGYAAGYNRYLRDTPRAALPAPCRDAAWVRPISEADLYRVLEEKVTQASGGAMLSAVVGAVPPAAGAAAAQRVDLAALEAQLQLDKAPIGSNGWAFGRAVSGGAASVLLANPHFPWSGSNRFYQSHLTIPGQLDVMGASLAMLPVINIGFNKDVAWTHTVSTSRRFTLFALRLVPGKPTHYLVDGQERVMDQRNVAIAVRAADGSMQMRQRTVYSTPLGPVVVLPSAGLTWSTATAFVLADANRHNARLIDTWLALNRAGSVGEIEAGLGNLGMPWVNTIGADRHGQVMYADISAVPNVSQQHIARCSPAPYQALFASARLLVLDGARSDCAWARSADAPVPGLMPRQQLPALRRDDYVANSNDSYWLANPQQPGAAMSPLLGAVAVEQGLRTRMGLTEIGEMIACAPGRGDCGVTPQRVQEALFKNTNLAARLVLDELLQGLDGADGVDVQAAARVLAAWDRNNGADSRGAHLFHEWWVRMRATPGFYRIGFDPADPVRTPRGINMADPRVRAAAVAALQQSVTAIRAAGFALDAPLGQLQAVTRDGARLVVPGGADREGVLNQIDMGALTPAGYLPNSGSSYVQTVSFEAGGPRAEGLLVYGQSADPASPLYFDQMALFTQKKLRTLPFNEAQIQASLISTLRLRE